MKATHWRLVIILAIVAIAAFYAWPRPGEDRPILNMNLGLDLKGGSHIVLKVETDDAIEEEAKIVARRVGEKLREEGLSGALAAADEAELGAVRVTGVPLDRLAEAETLLETTVGNWSMTRTDDGLRLKIPSSEDTQVRDRAVRQTLTAIRTRIDEFGVAEPLIQRVGGDQSDRILVQLPGVEDPSRVKDLLKEPAQLELRRLYYAAGSSNPFVGPDPDTVVALLGGSVPFNVDILPHVPTRPEGQEEIVQGYLAVEKTPIVTGNDLQDARPATGEFGDTVVSFTLRVTAAERFGNFTRDNIGKQMAVVLNGKVTTYPTIQGVISTSGQIEGNYTFEDADDLALVLRSGALPAETRIIEERTVGPSLGRDSIVSGASAAMLGFGLVMVFMVVYYKVSGLNAVVALLLNLLIVAAVMAGLGATLTLPGIGGFILTVGMAVDANVLIFERIREELRTGKTVRGALDAGFSKALSAILDANITTLIAALFLFQYGTGPVRGFAVTLSIGILASVFTAVFVSRTLFDLLLGDRARHTLSI